MNAIPEGDLKTSTCFKNFPSNLIIENEISKMTFLSKIILSVLTDCVVESF